MPKNNNEKVVTITPGIIAGLCASILFIAENIASEESANMIADELQKGVGPELLPQAIAALVAALSQKKYIKPSMDIMYYRNDPKGWLKTYRVPVEFIDEGFGVFAEVGDNNVLSEVCPQEIKDLFGTEKDAGGTLLGGIVLKFNEHGMVDESGDGSAYHAD